MPLRLTWIWRLLAYLIIISVGPLLGVWLNDQPLDPYLLFPPIPSQKQLPPFSWTVFFWVIFLTALCVIPFLYRNVSTSKTVPFKPVVLHFPLWGWLGVIIVFVAWLLAWNRFFWFENVQVYTFTPLWLGYIVVVNALTYRRTGYCLMTSRKPLLIALFPLSAVFWWTFEFLNRFVENWYYLGTSEFSPEGYFATMTLAFATVLPAVLSTAEWLNSYSGISARLDRFATFTLPVPKLLPWLLMTASVAGLAAVTIWPNQLFFLVWLMPLLLIAGLQLHTNNTGLIFQITQGDWRRVWTFALAGLVCGGFWEMWNSKSLAHWQYSIPYLQRFEIFAMPLPGYAGYLPFGIACGLFVEYLLDKEIAGNQ